MHSLFGDRDQEEDDAPMGVASALGLADSDDAAITDLRLRAMAAVARLWPVAAIALILIPSAVSVVAMLRIGAAALWSFVLPGGVTGLLAAACWALLRSQRVEQLPPHQRIAAVSASAMLMAVSLTITLGRATLLGPDLGLAVTVSLLGTIIVTVTALHALRAALLGFALSLAIMQAASHGWTLATAAAALIAALLLIGVMRVARAEQAALNELAEQKAAERLASRLVGEFENHSSGWFWQTDRQGRLSYLSAKVAREVQEFGIAALGQPLTAVFRVDSAQAETERTLTFHLSSRTSFSDYSVRPAPEDAAERWWSISGRPLLDELGRFQGFIGSGSDLTQKRRAEAEITRLALFDSLTGLANRQRMRLSLEQTLSQRTGSGTHGLFLLDLDRFKAVNDTLGHQVGDELLKQVAHRLGRTVGDAGLVGRLGGDEFEVVIPNEGSRERLGALADRVIQALSQSYYIEGSTITIGCSVGIAIAPIHGDVPETLVRNADLALYAAKADGRGVHRFYREELLEGAQNRKRLEDDLRNALRNDELHLAYQPVVSTRDERIVGYEALLRWQHPVRGPISPAEFVPIAEECGLIEAIGEWVMRTAAYEAASWPPHVRVAVNVSPVQFANPALPSIVTNALASSGLAPRRLELEITEGVFLHESASSDQMFKSLKGIGVRLALDDFGTGYSSLGYLKKAPFDKIKIDQSFVRGAIMAGNRNAAIIKAIVTLADTLGMETTAEGVEQQDEIALIRDLGCSHIQGYVYGRPMTSELAREQLGTNNGVAQPVGHKTSRAPRHKMLRSSRLELGTESGEVRIRDISMTGCMIDGVDLPEEAVGHDVRIELLDGHMFPAAIRWVDGEGRAGLQFAAPFDVERLNQPARAPTRRAA